MFRVNRKALIVTPAVLAMMLTACGSNAEDTAESAQNKASEVAESAKTNESNSESATTTTTTAQATDGTVTTESTVADQPADFAEVENICQQCEETASVEVEHPQYGPLTIKTLAYEPKPGAAPTTYAPYYSVYQGDKLIGMADGYTTDDGKGAEVLSWNMNPQIVYPTFTPWTLETGTNVDRYGHVFLGSADGKLTILTPTEKGYDSMGTLPNGDDGRFRDVTLTIDAEGEPRIDPNKDGTNPNGPSYIFQDGEWIEAS